MFKAAIALPDSEPKLMAEMLTTDAGRKALRRPRASPSTFAEGSATSWPARGEEGGMARPKVRWWMTG